MGQYLMGTHGTKKNHNGGYAHAQIFKFLRAFMGQFFKGSTP